MPHLFMTMKMITIKVMCSTANMTPVEKAKWGDGREVAE